MIITIKYLFLYIILSVVVCSFEMWIKESTKKRLLIIFLYY